MKQVLRTRAAAGLIAASAFFSAGTASANRTGIDGTQEQVATVCAAGSSAPCLTPTPLKTSTATTPLVANFGFGPFSSVYIYNNGLVSIGAAIAPGADLSSLASIGGNVFTAGYSPSRSVFTNVTIQGPQPAQSEFVNQPVVRVTFCYTAAGCNGDDQSEQFSIFDLGSGNYELTFNYGAFSSNDPPVFPADAYAGYSFGGNTNQVSGTTLQSRVTRLDSFQYAFSASTTSGVPEPSAWALMLLGFAGAGAALRRRRRAFAPVW